jgi:predicted ABC-type ATPase
VPEDTIRRRYRAGLKNFFELYQPIATNWQMFNNSQQVGMDLIAAGGQNCVTRIENKNLWREIQGEYRT